MTEKAQRIAIAEACGWTTRYNIAGGMTLYTKTGVTLARGDGWEQHLPDYPNDLNAMHEAEKAKAVDKDAFIFYLCGVLAYSCPSVEALEACIFATAAQRAEAFLRALNLWKN